MTPAEASSRRKRSSDIPGEHVPLWQPMAPPRSFWATVNVRVRGRYKSPERPTESALEGCLGADKVFFKPLIINSFSGRQ
mgnify:FL=1